MNINSILTNTIEQLSASKTIAHHAPAEISMSHKQVEHGDSGAKIEKLDHVISTLNKAAVSVDKRVSFQYNDKTRRIVMRIMDSETNELVRQVPTKEMVELLERINEMTGVFLDEKR